MDAKYLVTLRSPADVQTVHDQGCEVLAEYPDSALVRCTKTQTTALQAEGMEIHELPQPPVKMSGASFAFAQAVDANEAVPVALEPGRFAYFLVQLIGPPLQGWLEAINGLGGEIYGNMPGYVLLVGMLPAAAQALRDETWVEEITPFRPAMKVSPKLRPGVSRELTTTHLTTVAAASEDPNLRQQVEINVFPKESTATISAKIRSQGGTVLRETPTVVVAILPPKLIPELAAEQGIQSILPYELPRLYNNRAAEVMCVPSDGNYSDLTLTGSGEIVGIGDGGLDNGDPATLHLDIRGRVAGLVSQPIAPFWRSYTKNTAPFDDGPNDPHEAHGTHVTGSVLGNGAEASAHASTYIPQGIAPQAQVYFQAIEQAMTWKTAAELAADGLSPLWYPWPPGPVGLFGLPDDLNDLFTAAYTASARIHTNSWGSPVSGQYDSYARNVDEFMWNHRDMLILFSAGNEGKDDDNNGVIDPDSIGSPGTAKNCITVGASENNRPHGSTPTPGYDFDWTAWDWPHLGAAGHLSDNVEGMAAFSSRGPTDDGRIKPDVVAPGTNVLSVRSHDFLGADPLWGDLKPTDPLHGLYCWSGGTSMATPLVAGAAALVRQHLVQQRGHVLNGVRPSGALIKAFLVNGAVGMAGQFVGEIPAVPNTVEGFGRVKVMESVTPGSSTANALHQTLFADEPEFAVQTGQKREFQVQPVNLALPLKVTLVWTDAPAVAGLGGLVNQLYLQVVKPDGTVQNGDTSAYPTVSNNVQQVTVTTPLVAGSYTIRVWGVSVTQHTPAVTPGAAPRQDFALAVSNVMGTSLQPVSVAQAIDTTGSMDYFGYIGPAKERANQLADFMRGTDSLSVTEFSQRPGIPLARTVYPLRLLANYSPDWVDAHTSINGLVADGMTPIGAGLLEAWNQIHTPLASTHRGIVLLSDGLQNVPPDPFDPTVLPTIPADVPIFTVALGPASSASTLQDIAASRPGGSYHEVYTDEDIHKLHEIYAALQALVSGSSPVGLTSAQLEKGEEKKHDIPVEGGVQEVTFSLSWDDIKQPEQMEVIGPDGLDYNEKCAATLVRIGATYRYVRVAVPQAGLWTVILRNIESSMPVAYTLSTAVQSNLVLRAEANLAGQDKLVIQATLLQGGKPLDDADLVARVTLPTLSTEDALKQYADQLKDIQLPKTVDESGLSEDQRLLNKLAIFAMKFRGQEGGIFKRITTDVKLSPQGGGMWAESVPLSAPGNISVQVIAVGKADGLAWERTAIRSQFVPEKIERVVTIKIGRIYTRRYPLFHYTLIAAEVLKKDNTPATPADGVHVSMVISQGRRRIDLADAPYDRRGYYYWRFSVQGFLPSKATITVIARMNGQSVRETKVINI
jgi:serine protease AprX